MNGTFAVILSFIISLTQLNQGREKPINISAYQLQNASILYFTSGWRYSSTYTGNWASPGLNDSSWRDINTIRNDSLPSDWKGTGFFRFHFTIDSSLFNKSVYMHIWSAGKQKIYIDGNYISDRSDWRHPEIVTFNRTPDHLLAVMYINNKQL